jgi:hypothetical protein
MRRIGCLFLVSAAMVVWLAGPALARAASEVGSRSVGSPALTCSTSLKLHDGASQSGALATVSERGIWINLSSLGFDNRTSSFTVGACAIDMAAGVNGGIAHYESCLTPFCVENTMDPGWNNVISSVYLH